MAAFIKNFSSGVEYMGGSSLIITAFSVRHKLQVLPLQKFSETDANIFQVKWRSVFDFLSFQINCERAVSWR